MNSLRRTSSAQTVAPAKSPSTMINMKLMVAGVAIALAFGGGPVCNGAVMITMEESGNDVTATLSGAITNWTGATLTVGTTQTGGIVNRVAPSDTAFLFVNGPSLGAGTSLTRYSAPTYPTSLGPGTTIVDANTSTASTVLYILGRQLDNIFIADSYALNTPITGVLNWQNQTFGNMGLTPGSYIWSWGDPSTPGQGDKITLNIVPEPATYAIALAGLACSGYVMRRRKRT